jgi:hypothetical protein
MHDDIRKMTFMDGYPRVFIDGIERLGRKKNVCVPLPRIWNKCVSEDY